MKRTVAPSDDGTMVLTQYFFSVTLARSGMTATVHLAGEFDVFKCEEFEQAIGRAEAGDPARIVVDLSRLSFMDCGALRALSVVDARCREEGRVLCLVPGPPAVQRIFELTASLDEFMFTTPSGELHGLSRRRFERRRPAEPRWSRSAGPRSSA